MKPPRLCFILPLYDPNTDTHHFHLYELLERLSEELEILLIVDRASAKPCIGRIRDVHVIRAKRWPLKLIEYTSVILTARLKGFRTFYVHYVIAAGIVAAVIARLTGAKVFFWSCIEARAYFAPWSPKPLHLRRKLLVDMPMLLLFRLLDRLVTCSTFMAKYFVREFRIPEAKIVVLSNWVSLSRFRRDESKGMALRRQLGASPDSPIVLYAHTLTPHRGVHLICQIAEAVQAEIQQVKFVVVGNGPYRDVLLSEIKERGLETSVLYVGPVANRKMPQFLWAANVFINPAQHEAFGRVLLESMAAGVPFVSTDGGGGVLAYTTPLQQDYIVAPVDVSGFATKVVELLTHRRSRDRLIEEGLRVASMLSLENATGRFVDLIMAD